MIPAYTPEQMSDQYNNGKRVPDFENYLINWRERGVAARAQLRQLADLAYGAGARNRLDLFLPSSTAAAPLLIFVHGGYWQMLDKEDWSCVAAPYVAQGIAVAVVGYTLCPENTVAGIVEEIRQACAYLYLHADECGVARDKMSISGHSAGGHLTAMMLATDWPARDARLPKTLFHAAVAVSGLFDLEPLTITHINQALKMSAADALASSPILMQKQCDTFLLAAVGGDESPEFLRQSRSLAATWDRTRYLEVPGCNHFSVIDAFHDPSAPLFRQTCELVLAAMPLAQ
jgi:arylformamidase